LTGLHKTFIISLNLLSLEVGWIFRGWEGEAYFPTESKKAQANPWIPPTYEHQGRKKGAQKQTAKRPEEAICIGPRTRGFFHGAMVKKEERLRGRAQFRKIFARGKSYANRAAVLYVLPGARGCKVGFSAGKKLGGAVLRNRLKRVFREIYRQQRPVLKEGVCLVWIARAAAAGMEFNELKEALRELLERAGLVEGE